MTANDIIRAIDNGTFDASIADISRVVAEREAILRRRKKADLQVGDIIRFNSQTRPMYMQGRKGTIRAIKRTRVAVDLDNPCGRFHKNIQVPMNLVEKV